VVWYEDWSLAACAGARLFDHGTRFVVWGLLILTLDFGSELTHVLGRAGSAEVGEKTVKRGRSVSQ
jgi:hypothetical protein